MESLLTETLLNTANKGITRNCPLLATTNQELANSEVLWRGSRVTAASSHTTSFPSLFPHLLNDFGNELQEIIFSKNVHQNILVLHAFLLNLPTPLIRAAFMSVPQMLRGPSLTQWVDCGGHDADGIRARSGQGTQVHAANLHAVGKTLRDHPEGLVERTHQVWEWAPRWLWSPLLSPTGRQDRQTVLLCLAQISNPQYLLK